MTNIYGLMVVRNEASRYLQAALAHAASYLDRIIIFDDQSDDETREIASEFGDVVIRPDHISSFVENESEFRQHAWSIFEDNCSPTLDDWILAIDADEFLIADNPRESLFHYSQTASLGVSLRIPELWSIDPPLVRVDGYWDRNSSPRYFRYMPGGTFAGRRMGSAAFPTYVRHDLIAEDVEILHVGYLNEDDRVVKYNRYTSISEGHSSTHIESIIKIPTYSSYDKTLPNIYRGIL